MHPDRPMHDLSTQQHPPTTTNTTITPPASSAAAAAATASASPPTSSPAPPTLASAATPLATAAPLSAVTPLPSATPILPHPSPLHALPLHALAAPPAPSSVLALPVVAPQPPCTVSAVPPPPPSPSAIPSTGSVPPVSGSAATSPAAPRRNDGKRPSRAGAPNYTDEEVTALLDAVSAVQPLTPNEWNAVRAAFCAWASRQERPSRDADSLRSKFDKLANHKRRATDAGCPESIRRAKALAREMHNRVLEAKFRTGARSKATESASVAGTDGGETGAEEIEEGVAVGAGTGAGAGEDGAEEEDGAGDRRKRRRTVLGTNGGSGSEQTVMGLLSDMTKQVSVLAQALLNSTAGAPGMKNANGALPTHEAVTDVVRHEVDMRMRSVNVSLANIQALLTGMHSMLHSMANQSQRR